MVIPRVRVQIVALCVLTLSVPWACESTPSSNTNNSGEFQDIIEPDPALDSTAVITKGPYLHQPAEGSLTVNWETAVPSSSRVLFGPVGGDMQEVAGYTYKQLPSTTDPLLVGTIPKNYQHSVMLTGLVPGEEYTYKVLSSIDQPEGTFMGPPAPGDEMSFIVFGDTRTGHEHHERVISGMMDYVNARGIPAFNINTGDLTMTGGSDDEWNRFFQIEAPLMSSVPTLAVFGNHDFILGRTAFEAFFRAPPTSTSPSDRYYSAVIGDVHITVVDVQTMELEPHEDWVEADLAASTAPFKIAAIHPPLFTNSNHAPHFRAREILVPLFEQYGVQMVVWGHNHCYERFVGYGSYYITAGGGGAPLYGVDDHLEYDNGTAVRHAALKAYHFLWATVSGNEMTIEVVAGDDANAPVDQVIDCFKLFANEPITASIPCN